MTRSVKMLVVPALVLAAACGRDQKPMDDALKNDLSLASSMQPYQPQQFVSPMEQGYAGYGYGAVRAAAVTATTRRAPQPVAQRRIYRAPAARSSGTSSTGTARTGTQVVKNTKRDAIIGGVAGAAIGAVTLARQAQGCGDRRCRRQRARRGDRQQRGREEDSILSTLVRSDTSMTERGVRVSGRRVPHCTGRLP